MEWDDNGLDLLITRVTGLWFRCMWPVSSRFTNKYLSAKSDFKAFICERNGVIPESNCPHGMKYGWKILDQYHSFGQGLQVKHATSSRTTALGTSS